MEILKVSPISFGYKSVLKTEWQKGNMPTVTRDIYGDLLIKGQETIDHIIPKSKGGKSTLSNYALANAGNNFRRSNLELGSFTNTDLIKAYLRQFEGIKLHKFNGDEYIKGITKTLKRLGFKL